MWTQGKFKILSLPGLIEFLYKFDIYSSWNSDLD